MLAPLGLDAVLASGQAVPDREVSHEPVRGGAVPVPLPRRAPGAVPLPNHDDRASAGLGETNAVGDVQGLAVGVAVPGGSGSRGEVHRVDLAARFSARGDDIEVDVTCEPLGRPLDRGLLVQDLHLSSSGNWLRDCLWHRSRTWLAGRSATPALQHVGPLLRGYGCAARVGIPCRYTHHERAPAFGWPQFRWSAPS